MRQRTGPKCQWALQTHGMARGANIVAALLLAAASFAIIMPITGGCPLGTELAPVVLSLAHGVNATVSLRAAADVTVSICGPQLASQSTPTPGSGVRALSFNAAFHGLTFLTFRATAPPPCVTVDTRFTVFINPGAPPPSPSRYRCPKCQSRSRSRSRC